MVPSTTTAITSVVVKEKFGSGSYETLTPNDGGRVTVNQGHTLQIIATAASGYSWRADSDVSFDFGCATLSSKNATPTTFTVTAVANDTGRITIDDPVSTITGVLSDGMFSIYAAGSNSTMPPGTTYDLSHTPSISALLGYAASSVTSVTVVDSVAPKSTMSWFSGLSNLTTITGLDNVGVSQVNDFTGLFKNCSSLTTVNIGGISSLTTSAVLDEMFYGCSSLAIIHADMDTDWSTSSYTGSSEDMFAGCTALQNALHARHSEIEIADMPTDKSYARIDVESSAPGYFTVQ